MYLFKVEVTYRMVCSRCGRETSETQMMYPGPTVWNPSRPLTWRVLDGALICDEHEIVVSDRKPRLDCSIHVNGMISSQTREYLAKAVAERLKECVPPLTDAPV